MKKLIVSLTLLAASCMGAFAQQEIFDNPDNSPYFGYEHRSTSQAQVTPNSLTQVLHQT